MGIKSIKLPNSQAQYLIRNVGLSSGRILRRSYRRVVETFAWPSHSWTLAISASCESALVAAVARSECTQRPFTSALMPVSRPYFRTMLR